MKKLIKYISFLSIILYFVLPISIFAEYTSFSNAKNARELIKMANEQHLRVNLRSVPARTIAQFDTVDHINISGKYIYANWYNSLRFPNYLGIGIDDVKREFNNSNITLKILYTPTYSDNYNRVAKQSINPGQTIYATKIIKTNNQAFNQNTKPEYKGFTKPKLIQGGSNSQNTNNQINSQNTYMPMTYDETGNTILTLHVYKYAGGAKNMINLSGFTLEEARVKIKQANLPIGYIQDIYEKTSKPNLYGKIFEQTIKTGTLVDKPQYMGVKIYAFPKMPDLTKGWTVKKAEKTAYLSLIHLYTTTYNKNQDGIIFEQSIAPGTTLIKKTLVTVKAYKYENPYYRADFIHLNQDKAIEIAKQRNLEYEIITKDIFEYFNSTTLGNDFYQKQDNTVVDVTQNGNKLILTIVKFMQKEGIMPDFVEQTCSDIVKPMYELKQKIPGLTYTTKYIPETTFKKSDKIASTSPKAGSKLKSLDSVIFYCRRFTGNQADTHVIIPDLRKKTQKEATQTLENLGFTKIKTIKVKELGFVQGTVVNITGYSPHPIIGKKHYKNNTINLYIADANAIEMYLMPNVVGQTMKDAKDTLLNYGFNKIKFTDETKYLVKFTKTFPESVISTTPSYKAIVDHNEEVELIVRLKQGEKLFDNINLPSSKEKSNTVLIPAVKATLNDTIKEMENKGLIPLIKKVTSKNLSLKGTIDSDTVPPYNTIVPKNTKVSITTYVNSVNMPNVSNYIMSNFMTGTSYKQYYTKEHAISELEKQGFNVQLSYKNTDNTSLHDKVSSQNPKGGTSVDVGTTVKLVIFGPIPIQPSIKSNIKLSQVPSSIVEQIENFYKTFKKAYESKDEYQVVSLLIDDWASSDGGDISDLEDTLSNIFSVFDEVQYNISDLNIENSTQDKYIVSYNLIIKAQIYENDIEHIEKSSVKEEVIIKNGKVKIVKTINGKFWSIQ